MICSSVLTRFYPDIAPAQGSCTAKETQSYVRALSDPWSPMFMSTILSRLDVVMLVILRDGCSGEMSFESDTFWVCTWYCRM